MLMSIPTDATDTKYPWKAVEDASDTLRYISALPEPMKLWFQIVMPMSWLRCILRL